MEIVHLIFAAIAGFIVGVSDSMSLMLNWILFGVFMLFGCFTVGKLSDQIESGHSQTEDDSLFYGKIKIKYPVIRVKVKDGVHPIVLLWATVIYLLGYSLLRKYELADKTALMVATGLAFLHALSNWFRLNMLYAEAYSENLNNVFKSRTKTEVKLSTAIRYMLNELQSKLADEFAKFCECNPYLDSDSARNLQLREVLNNNKVRYIDHLGLRADLDLDIESFLVAQRSRIRSFLNEKFVGLWPEYPTRYINFDVLFIKCAIGWDTDSKEQPCFHETIFPMIVCLENSSDFRRIYGSDSTATQMFLSLQEADNLRHNLKKFNGVHCIVLAKGIEYKSPYQDNETDGQALDALIENLRSAITLKPKKYEWHIFNFFTAWPFYLVNFVTMQMFSKAWSKFKGMFTVVLTYFSKAAVKDL